MHLVTRPPPLPRCRVLVLLVVLLAATLVYALFYSALLKLGDDDDRQLTMPRAVVHSEKFCVLYNLTMATSIA